MATHKDMHSTKINIHKTVHTRYDTTDPEVCFASVTRPAMEAPDAEQSKPRLGEQLTTAMIAAVPASFQSFRCPRQRAFRLTGFMDHDSLELGL